LGANLTALIVFSGFSALLTGFPLLRTVLFLLSLVYFTYFAIRIGFAGTKLHISSQRVPRCRDGIMLMIINPKAYLTMSALFLGFPLFSFNPLNELIIKVIVANIIWIPGHLLWLYAGVKVNSLNLSPRSKRAINLILAAAIVFIVFGSAIVSIQTRV
jgi:threonine/homoserine/homoserine lactone efflux protein